MVLGEEPFRGLKAILDSLAGDQEQLSKALQAATSFQDLIARLGFRVEMSPQIHVQDCYSRVGRAGGIKTVLPYNDIATHSSFPTLVNYDGSVTTTPKAAEFFNRMLAELKQKLSKP